MEKNIVGFLILFTMLLTSGTGYAAQRSLCKPSDETCKEMERLARDGRFDAIISRVESTEQYSETARNYIGQAYLALAAAETNTAEQEEAFCRKALEFGSTQAYMGLYFIYAQKDEETALGFLKQYVSTTPRDSVPYVILGESELNKRNYRLADTYLRESKKVARASSSRVDWLLFQVNYLLGNYKYAAEMLESALSSGSFDQQLKELASDIRFRDIAERPEFRKYEQLIAVFDGRF